MPRRPATLTQSDVARIVRAAKQAGAESVDIQLGESKITINLREKIKLDRPDADMVL